jgi:hypothetical protein
LNRKGRSTQPPNAKSNSPDRDPGQ